MHVIDAQCVVHHDMIFVGGRDRSFFGDRLFVSCTDPISWREFSTPTSCYALSTFRSQLVLIGGYTANKIRTNLLWTSDSGENWDNSLPHMPTRRALSSAVSIERPEHLIVAGGIGDYTGTLNTVEVLTDNEWWTAEPLPKCCRSMKSTLHNGKWYLMGGYTHGYYCDVNALLLWHQLSHDQRRKFPSLWCLFEVPLSSSSIVSFREHLICYSQDIAAFSPLSQMWVNVGKLPGGLCGTASVVLQTGELVVVGSSGVTKASWKGENSDYKGEVPIIPAITRV